MTKRRSTVSWPLPLPAVLSYSVTFLAGLLGGFCTAVAFRASGCPAALRAIPGASGSIQQRHSVITHDNTGNSSSPSGSLPVLKGPDITHDDTWRLSPTDLFEYAGFSCVAGMDRPWAIVHDSDYDLRALRVQKTWVPEFDPAIPVLLNRSWSVIRVSNGDLASAPGSSDMACALAPEHCLALSCTLLNKLSYPRSACEEPCVGTRTPSTNSARNAAVLIAAACGASHVLELSSAILLNASAPDTLLLNPTAAAWASAPTRRARMAGAGNFKIMAADEPASGGLVHALAHLGEPLLFARGLPVARIPNVSMSVLDLRASTDEHPPAVPIHVFMPDGTPDVSAPVRALRRGLFPRPRPTPDFPPLVRALNPGSISPFGGIATLYSRDALWALFLLPSCRCDGGVWGSEAVRSIIAQATLQLAGATVAFVDGRQNFYRPFAPVDTRDLQAESLADGAIDGAAAVLVPSLREAIASLHEPSDALTPVSALDFVLVDLTSNGALQHSAPTALDVWLQSLRRQDYFMPQLYSIRPDKPFVSPISLCKRPASATPSPSARPRHRVRLGAAMCVTGETQYFDGAVSALRSLRPYFPDDNLHVFLFGAAFSLAHSEAVKVTDLRTTRTFLYGDRIIFGHQNPDLVGLTSETGILPDAMPEAFRQGNNDYQQYWGMSVCYEAVTAWAEAHGIEYELLIRQRTDHYLDVNATLFPAPLPPGYGLDHIAVPSDDHFGAVNDRWAIGGLSLMWHHLGRYCKLVARELEPEWFEPLLFRSLNESGVRFVLESGVTCGHMTGEDDQLERCGMRSPSLPALTRSV